MDVNTNETRNGNIVKALEESRSHANGLMGFGTISVDVTSTMADF